MRTISSNNHKGKQANNQQAIIRRTAALDPDFSASLQSLQDTWLSSANEKLTSLLSDVSSLKDMLIEDIKADRVRNGKANPDLIFRSINTLLKMVEKISEQVNLNLGRPTEITASMHASVKRYEDMSEDELDSAMHRTLKHLGWTKTSPPPKIIDVTPSNGDRDKDDE